MRDKGVAAVRPQGFNNLETGAAWKDTSVCILGLVNATLGLTVGFESGLQFSGYLKVCAVIEGGM